MPGKKGRLVIVSNRLPVTIVKRAGEYQVQPSAGGLVTAINSLFKRGEYVWLGWTGMSAEKARDDVSEIETKLRSLGYEPLFLPQEHVENFYHGFCNDTIWPLFHYFPSYSVFSERLWYSYRKANELFAEKLLKVAGKGDTIWIHDYHLMLLPSLIREKLPDATIGFFLHIPFPSYEIYRLLPWREEILKGLLGADLIGFHTYDYVFHFLDSLRRILGIESSMGQVIYGTHMIKVDAFPIGIDYERYSRAPLQQEVQGEMAKIRQNTRGRKLILSVDRLDYSKGILNRLEAFEMFLEKYPDFREKVSLILVVVPSRLGVEHYRNLKKQVDEFVGRINGRYGSIRWVPIWYLYRFLPFEKLTALYATSDVALITPLRDGMNLVAKEYAAVRRDGTGVIVLSEMAGASKELCEAILINPTNIPEMAEGIYRALTMPRSEQVKRNRRMQERLRRYDVRRWLRDFMEGLRGIKENQKALKGKILTRAHLKRLIEESAFAEKRLFILDYDGTLVPFTNFPEDAVPDEDLKVIISELSTLGEVIIASGRDRKTLSRWFENLPVNLIAEHGTYVKPVSGRWRLTGKFNNDWKKQIRPLMEFFVDRTPGSLLEEKTYSLAWHYRGVESEMAQVRAGELREMLYHLTSHMDVTVLEGNRVIEVKNMGIDKGKAIKRWLERDNWDFILCTGDDWTDEYMFEVLPESAYSIKVGGGFSKAKYHVRSWKQVREILLQILGRDPVI